ncbi:MAG: hypothetical protein V4722_15465 [Bacteroidota bacterium]
MNLKKLVFLLCCCVVARCYAQDIKAPLVLRTVHPRLVPPAPGNEAIKTLVSKEEWAKKIYDQAKQNVDVYVDRHQKDSSWMISRLQMYWKTKSTEVFIKGGVYDHVAGSAPVATVKFPGMRGGVSAHAAPKLEDLQPYMDDPRGLYLLNKTTSQMEWADISKTGSIIEGINNNIMRMGYTSAALYFITGEEKYAEFSFDLFDTYMSGMQYRKEPFDLSYGHHQTLAGLSSFEVIQEVAILNSLTGSYDFLYQYIQQHAPKKNDVYQDVFKKWADIQIAHGVAFNNWNLMQAKNVLNIALMLDDDKNYNDGKGNQYYTNYILNTNSQRQWSLQKVVHEGFDPNTGLWNEAAGYSLGVLNDVIGFVGFFNKYYQVDLIEKMPVLKKAVMAVTQYLFPNGYFASFGDSHYGHIGLGPAYLVIANARRNNKPDQEELFTKYIKTVEQYFKERNIPVESREADSNGINALIYTEDRTGLTNGTVAGDMNDYCTPVFSSPLVSFFALRNELDTKKGLMVAMSGSKGNHMHAGGMSMEIYGKGFVLGPESGIGTNYFQADYAEYYSQFPAHNTVAVDGISAYPVMKSNHGFEVTAAYPASGVSKDYFKPVSFGGLQFLEPETNANQNRLISIIRTGEATGYYIDIFRSRRKDGKDKMHDYFYHNMGQELLLNDNDGTPLPLSATEKLSFGGGHLFAYDYLYDKKSVITTKDINAVFKLNMPGGEAVEMNMWMKGEKDREVFAVKAPRSTAIDRMGLPKEIAELPLPTIVARQAGEAWTKPFVVVFEPSSNSQPQSVASIQPFTPKDAPADFVGLEIAGKAGDKQIVFSDVEGKKEIKRNDQLFTGTYGVIGEGKHGLEYLFLGNGKKISSGGYGIVSSTANASAALQHGTDGWFYTASVPVVIHLPISILGKQPAYKLSTDNKTVTGKKQTIGGIVIVAFELPAATYTKIEWK